MTKKGIWEPCRPSVRRPLCISLPLNRPRQAMRSSLCYTCSVIHSLIHSVLLALPRHRVGAPCVSSSEVMFIQIKTTPIS